MIGATSPGLGDLLPAPDGLSVRPIANVELIAHALNNELQDVHLQPASAPSQCPGELDHRSPGTVCRTVAESIGSARSMLGAHVGYLADSSDDSCLVERGACTCGSLAGALPALIRYGAGADSAPRHDFSTWSYRHSSSKACPLQPPPPAAQETFSINAFAPSDSLTPTAANCTSSSAPAATAFAHLCL